MAELPPVNQLHYARMKRALTASLLKPKGDPLVISASEVGGILKQLQVDQEVSGSFRAMDAAQEILAAHAVFLSAIYLSAHDEAVQRRRQLRREELETRERFHGNLAVSVLTVRGRIKEEYQGTSNVAFFFSVNVPKAATQSTTASKGNSMEWEQDFGLEVVAPTRVLRVSLIK
ncbi:hypothetical protein T484DRAFT_1897026, partial [Baffinella frigidus]